MLLLILSITFIAIITFCIFIFLLLEKTNSASLSHFKWNNNIIIISFMLLSTASFLLALSLYYTYELIENVGNFKIDYSKLGPYGDLIGGIMNPVVAFIGIIAASLAFYAQYRANSQVQKQFKIQQFESQFYEMLRIHNSNVQEMDIANKIKGRKCFMRMFYEFEFIYLSLFNIYDTGKDSFNWNYTKEELSDFAYKVFFFGIGSISNRVILRLIDETHHPIIVLLIKNLEDIQNNYNPDTEDSNEVATPFEDQSTIFTFEMFYFPFDGHSTRLGHYYRHLFQTVSYIVNTDVITKRLEKYKYLKLVRAQLSNHEQLLLYYNGISSFGNEWIITDYFTTHRMIKNIPLELANFGKRPKDKLGTKNSFGENIFEWS